MAVADVVAVDAIISYVSLILILSSQWGRVIKQKPEWAWDVVWAGEDRAEGERWTVNVGRSLVGFYVSQQARVWEKVESNDDLEHKG